MNKEALSKLNGVVKAELSPCYHFITEPGDMTRYDFYVHEDGPDKYTICPRNSTFRFPQRVDIYEARSVLLEAARCGYEDETPHTSLIAKREDCNPYTVLEVCRVVVHIHEVKNS